MTHRLVDPATIHRQLTAPGAQFEIVPVTIDGVQFRTYKNTPNSLRAVFDATTCFDDRTYLVYEQERLTYRQVREQVMRLAFAMQDELGIGKGERVAIAMRNYPEAVIAFWAVTWIGAVVVPLNAWWTGAELGFALADCAARLLIADPERLARVASQSDALDGRLAVLVRGEIDAAPTGETVHAWHSLLDRTPSRWPEAPPLHPDDDATIFYTSGTTGRPKGALGTHRNFCGYLANSGYFRARAALRHGDPLPDPSIAHPQKTTLLTVPLFHVTGCHSLLAAGTVTGNKIVLMYRWDPTQALELIEREAVNVFGGVPTVLWQILDAPELSTTDVSTVERVMYGGSPAAPDLVTQIVRRFPNAQPGTGYGLTECSSAVSNNVGADYVAHPDSVGVCSPVCDLRVVDEQGVDVPSGGRGELLVRGPTVIRRYWNRPDADAETLAEGWLHTGDIVRIDAEGFIYLLDRAKEVVIRGGENVYCVEVEDILFAHPAIVDAAVFGLPDRVLGEEVAAAVQLSRGAVVEVAAIRAHVAQHLAAFKVPSHVAIYPEPLPRNANGKIVKPVLRSRMLGEDGAHHRLGEWSAPPNAPEN